MLTTKPRRILFDHFYKGRGRTNSICLKLGVQIEVDALTTNMHKIENGLLVVFEIFNPRRAGGRRQIHRAGGSSKRTRLTRILSDVEKKKRK